MKLKIRNGLLGGLVTIAAAFSPFTSSIAWGQTFATFSDGMRTSTYVLPAPEANYILPTNVATSPVVDSGSTYYQFGTAGSVNSGYVTYEPTDYFPTTTVTTYLAPTTVTTPSMFCPLNGEPYAACEARLVNEFLELDKDLENQIAACEANPPLFSLQLDPCWMERQFRDSLPALLAEAVDAECNCVGGINGQLAQPARKAAGLSNQIRNAISKYMKLIESTVFDPKKTDFWTALYKVTYQGVAADPKLGLPSMSKKIDALTESIEAARLQMLNGRIVVNAADATAALQRILDDLNALIKELERGLEQLKEEIALLKKSLAIETDDKVKKEIAAKIKTYEGLVSELPAQIKALKKVAEGVAAVIKSGDYTQLPASIATQ